MGAPSRPTDSLSLLTSALNHIVSAKAQVPSDSSAAASLDAAILAIAELIAQSSSSAGALQTAPVNQIGGTETLLVVEDNETILTLVTNALSRLGYKVLSAIDGPTALERYGRSDDDIKLLVTDVMMPRMSGRELAIQLTALRPTMKVLYASGYTQDVTARHGVFEPDVNFIQKPYTPQRLAARIRQLLDAPPD
jgi:CheY-like chemotaxis protein